MYLRSCCFYADNITSWDDAVITYDPVWAIGIGKVASPQQAQEAHLAVHDWLKNNISPDVSSTTPIIYGGNIFHYKRNHLLCHNNADVTMEQLLRSTCFCIHLYDCVIRLSFIW